MGKQAVLLFGTYAIHSLTVERHHGMSGVAQDQALILPMIRIALQKTGEIP